MSFISSDAILQGILSDRTICGEEAHRYLKNYIDKNRDLKNAVKG